MNVSHIGAAISTVVMDVALQAILSSLVAVRLSACELPFVTADIAVIVSDIAFVVADVPLVLVNIAPVLTKVTILAETRRRQTQHHRGTHKDANCSGHHHRFTSFDEPYWAALTEITGQREKG
jgi:heme exporter protein D